MKKKWLIPIVIIAILGILLLVGYTAFHSVFPMAGPITCPKTEDVIAISLIRNNDTSVALEFEEFDEILQNIINAQPTREMSVNDYPAVKNYCIIDIDTTTREYQYFIYAENSQVYIERPYEGIYKSDQQFLDFVTERFKD